MTYPNGNAKTESLLPRRLAIMDIETTSLDAMTGRVACIGLLFDNAVALETQVICEQDEKKLLERFWAAITENDLLVGHNILEFDLMFIRQRSWILGVKPPLALNLKKYYTDQVVDLMALWTNWSYKYKGAGLDNIAQALGLGGKTGHGSEVAALWANGEYVKVMDYCMSDVWLTYAVYCKMHYREPLGVPIPKVIAPQREPVYVLAQQNRVQAEAPAQTPLIASPLQESCPPSVPQPSNRSRRNDGPREIFYRKDGSAVVLTGFTVTIKDTLKQIYGAYGRKISERPNRYEWVISADKLAGVNDLCQKSGINLLPMGNGTMHLPQGA